MKTLCCLLLAGNLQFVEPSPSGGFTVTDPLDPKALTNVTPNGDGSFTATKPFRPRELQIITPNGDGYTVFSPFQEPNQ